MSKTLHPTQTDFIREWRNSMWKDCKKYVAMIDDQELIESLSEYLDEQTIDPLHKMVVKKGKINYFKESEGEELEYKESIFPNKRKLKKEFVEAKKASKIDPSMNFKTYQLDKNEELMNEVVETVCAFLNTKGGKLWIGVTDKRKVVGIETENSNSHFQSHMSFEKFKEKYLDYISAKLHRHFSNQVFFVDYTDPYKMTKDEPKTLFLIQVRESNKPAFVRVPDGKKEREIPYLREGSGDFPYDGRDPDRPLSKFYAYWESKNS